MKKEAIYRILLIGILLTGATLYIISPDPDPFPSQSEIKKIVPNVPTNLSLEDQKQAIKIISSFIIEKKGWPKEAFRIQYVAYEGDLLVYVILHQDDDRPIAGATKSVFVDFDPEKMKVTQMWHAQ